MAAAAVAAPSATRLVCGTICTLQARLGTRARIAALDVTKTHLGLALSDVERTRAAPFGVLRRSESATTDARILKSAFMRANEAGLGKLDVAALVVASPPGVVPSEYVRELLADPDLLPGVQSILYYSEAHAVVRAVNASVDIAKAVETLQDRRESRKRHRFAVAMYPDIEPADFRTDRAARARISATDVLQAALEDLARLPAADGS